MIANALNNQYQVWFPRNFFYSEIETRWLPVIKRLKLPYLTLEDFINAAIQNVSFPQVELNLVSQQQSEFEIVYRGGKELEPILDKNLSITFKLSEGFFTYWILFEQIELYMKYADSNPFWPPMHISFLDHHGFEIIVFSFEKITPTSLTPFQLSYAQTAAEFNTFDLNLRYNRFNIQRRLSENVYTKNKN